MISLRNRPIPHLIDMIWLFLLSAYVLTGLHLVPFHGDESTLIYMGRDYYYQFVQGDLDLVRYSPDPDSVQPDGATQQHLRMLNGTVMKNLYGLTAWVSEYDITAINGQWVWGWDYQTNIDNSNYPPADLLLRTRFVSALMLVGAMWALYALMNRLGGRVSALIAVTYFALSPAVLVNGRRAMMEGGMLAFTLLTVLLGFYVIRSRKLMPLIGLGIVAGIAIATKHTSAFTVTAIFFSIGSAWLWESLRTRTIRWQDWAGLISATVLTIGVFIALNPAWWDAPLERAQDVLAMRNDMLSGQVNAFGGYPDLSAQFEAFLREGFIAQPAYAEALSFPIEADIQAYENSGLMGISIGGSVVGGILLGFVCAIGMLSLITSTRTQACQRWLILMWVAFMIILTLFITPLDWQRYYLPLYPAIAVTAGLGSTHLLTYVRNWRKGQTA